MEEVLGLHHVSVLGTEPQRDFDFYSGVLGLRLVKRTVDFDDPSRHHLYFGDGAGTPGSLLTTFPRPGADRGRPGPGQVAVVSFSIVPPALGFWIGRLTGRGIRFRGPEKRSFGDESEQVLSFAGPDGLLLELVASERAAERTVWKAPAGFAADDAIRALHAPTLWVARGDETASLLESALGLRRVGEHGTTRRFAVGQGGPGRWLDVRTVGEFARAIPGAGTVHHLAVAVADETVQETVRRRVAAAGIAPTGVLDRRYFRSIYFREPGGVLLEIATVSPGLTVDEPVERLGGALQLPSDLEGRRSAIESALPALQTEPASFRPRGS